MESKNLSQYDKSSKKNSVQSQNKHFQNDQDQMQDFDEPQPRTMNKMMKPEQENKFNQMNKFNQQQNYVGGKNFETFNQNSQQAIMKQGQQAQVNQVKSIGERPQKLQIQVDNDQDFECQSRSENENDDKDEEFDEVDQEIQENQDHEITESHQDEQSHQHYDDEEEGVQEGLEPEFVEDNSENQSNYEEEYNQEIENQDGDEEEDYEHNQDSQNDQVMTDQDNDGHGHQQDDSYQEHEGDEEQPSQNDDQEQEDSNEDEEEEEEESLDEGNIPASSQEISPDIQKKDKQYYQNKLKLKKEEDIQDEVHNSSNLSSNVRSSTSPMNSQQNLSTFNQYEQPMILAQSNNNNEKKVMMEERNDRFIIFKMVPQINKTKKTDEEVITPLTLASLSQQQTEMIFQQNKQLKNAQNQIIDTRNQTNSIGSQNILNNIKTSADTVEDIKESSDEEDNSGRQQLSIKYMNSSQDQFQQRQKNTTNLKQQIITISNDSGQNSLTNQSITMMQKQIQKPKPHHDFNEQNQIKANRSEYNLADPEGFLIKDNDSSEILRNSSSVISYHRSSSEKFNKLLKLEKKNIADEGLEDQTQQIRNLSQQHHQNLQFQNQNQQQKSAINEKALINKNVQEFNELLNYERRASDSIVVRSSTLKEIKPQIIQQIQENRSNFKQSTDSNDPETELLKQEYLKLKQTLNKLKKDPTPAPAQLVQQKVSGTPQKIRPQIPNKPQQQRQPVTTNNKQLLQDKKSIKLENIDSKSSKGRNQKKNTKDQNYEDSESDRDLRQTPSDNGNDEDDLSEENIYPQKSKAHRKSLTPTSIEKKSKKNNKGGIHSQQDSSKAAEGQQKMQAWKQQLKGMRDPVTEDVRRKQSKPRKESKANASSKNRNNNDKNSKHIRQHSKYNVKNKQLEKSLSDRDPSGSSKQSQESEEYQTKRKKNKFQQKKQSVQVKRRAKQSSNSSERKSEYDDQSERTTSHRRNQNDSSEDDDQNVKAEYDSEDDSAQESDSQNSSQSSSKRKTKKNQKKGSKNKKDKTKKQNKDRKLKININMNGNGQYSRQMKKDIQQTQEDYLIQQRQLLQQQQYLLAMAQYPQNNLLQQQALLQPQLGMPIVYPSAPLQPQQQSFFGQIQQQEQLKGGQINFYPSQKNQGAILGQNSLQNTQMKNNFGNPRSLDDVEELRNQLSRNLSGKQIHTQIPSSQFSQISSPKRQNFPSLGNNQQQQTSMRSPRDQQLASQKYLDPSSQPNYLNHLKNRFLSGGPVEEITNMNSQESQSRNQGQNLMNNNSTPGQRQTDEERLYIKQQYDYENRFNKDRSQERVFEHQYGTNKNTTPHLRTNSVQNQISQKQSQSYYQQQNFANRNQNPSQDRKNIISSEFAQRLKMDKHKSSSQDNGGDSEDEMSIDEGIQESVHKVVRSPKQSTAFKKNPGQRDSVFKNNSNIKRTSNNKQELQSKREKEQDKKGPQALWIGFEGENQTKNPFANKPSLKNRVLQKEKIVQQRSKSTRGPVTKPQIKSKKDQELIISSPPQKINAKQNKQDILQDKQLRSPINNPNLKQKDLPPKAQPQMLNATKIDLLSPKRKSGKIEEVKATPSTKDQLAQLKNQQKAKQQQIGKQQQAHQEEEEEEFLDPSHNKGLVIEIFDKKKKNGHANQNTQEVSLADMFKKKKKDVVEKLDHKKQQDQDGEGQEDASHSKALEKKGRTKEEILEQRKAMMKSKVKTKVDNFGIVPESQTEEQKKNGKKEPAMELQHRLAKGEKVKIDPKEAKLRTNKNYENLPEIKKKKEEEKKQQELAARKAAAADYMKQMHEKRRNNLKKKKSQNEEMLGK